MSVFFVTTDYYTMIYTDTVMFKSLEEPLLQNFSIYLGAPFAWLSPVDLVRTVMERAWDGMSGRPGQLEKIVNLHGLDGSALHQGGHTSVWGVYGCMGVCVGLKLWGEWSGWRCVG